MNATTSPKNLALAITAGKFIAARGLSATQASAAIGYYVVLASVSIVIPVVFYFVGGEKSTSTLRRWRDVATVNAAAAMEITLVVLGFAMSVKGLHNLLT